MKLPITHVVVENIPQLNVTQACLSHSPASLEFDGSFESRIPTATGFVRSLKSYAIARLVLNLKGGPVSSQWWARIQHHCIIGSVSAYDVNGGRSFKLSDCAITHVQPGHGGESTTRIIIGGTITKEAAFAGLSLCAP